MNDISSPFVAGNIIKDPAQFWGRDIECQNIINRLKKMGSTSIIGPRRIGKSSLAYHIYVTAPQKLSSENYEFVWIDGQSNHSSYLNNFFTNLSNSCSLEYHGGNSLKECLINFEDSVKAHDKKLIIIINEFEILTDEEHINEFGKQFYNTLRMLSEQSYCALITISCKPLKELCKKLLGISSPFYNIFEEIPLKNFTVEEADLFLRNRHDNVSLRNNEISFIKKNIAEYQHPLILQISCDVLFKNRLHKKPKKDIFAQIKERTNQFLTHNEVVEVREMIKSSSNQVNSSKKISKGSDLLVSIFIPFFGIGFIMYEYAWLISSFKLSNFQAVLVALVTSILGFTVLVFAGRSTNIIGESTFYKLFLKMINQIPLLSNVLDKLIDVADKAKK